MANGR
jgi:hypothetical protein